MYSTHQLRHRAFHICRKFSVSLMTLSHLNSKQPPPFPQFQWVLPVLEIHINDMISIWLFMASICHSAKCLRFSHLYCIIYCIITLFLFIDGWYSRLQTNHTTCLVRTILLETWAISIFLLLWIKLHWKLIFKYFICMLFTLNKLWGAELLSQTCAWL